jgi:uncharacterized ferredoxin-like protein
MYEIIITELQLMIYYFLKMIKNGGYEMIYNRQMCGDEAALHVAKQMVAAMVTAPKAHGWDDIDAIILTGEEKAQLAVVMRELAAECGEEFIERDSYNIENCNCVILVGARTKPMTVKGCGYCGFGDCAGAMKAGANCAFNTVDLGIAIGSAVSLAADNRIDSRVFYSAGKAVLRMGLFPKDVKVALAIPLSVTTKSMFFDRSPESVMIK